MFIPSTASLLFGAATLVTLSVATLPPLPLTPARALTPEDLKYSMHLFGRQFGCPAEQKCGEGCCTPPQICDVGAFNWCHGVESEGLCATGLAVCSDGTSCCRIGYQCDLVARMCYPPNATTSSELPESTSEDLEETSSASATATQALSSTTSTRAIASTTATQVIASTTGSAPPPATTTPSAGNALQVGEKGVQILAIGAVALGIWGL